MRAAYYRQLNNIIETGRQDSQSRSLINMLFVHHDRLASHLFSPSQLQFTVDYENAYPKDELERAAVGGRLLTRDWERSNTDMIFGQGVFEALKYGAAILKQWPKVEGDNKAVRHQSALVMPWQFGVYREDVNDLARQPAFCETYMLTMPEVWNRVCHLPEAEDLYRRIQANSAKGQASDEYNSFFHQVMSTSQLSTSPTGATRPTPGGIVDLNSGVGYGVLGPEIAVNMVRGHELWLWQGDDYLTVQIIEPDILIAPRYRKANLLVGGDEPSGLQPYTLIQPNQTHGYFWGRAESVDLIAPQALLSDWADDVKRLFGVQLDKILGFQGYDGLTDELYDQSREAGFFNGPPGSAITDLTPKFPPEALTMLDKLMKIIDMLGGFDNILSGQGEQGVRAGVHAETLLKTASPRLRDRSLLVERQCAEAGDLWLSVMQAKDAKNYWTKGGSEDEMAASSFLLSDLPDDRRVSVDSHSSSPIFADDHQNLVGFGVKSGFVDGHMAIELLNFPQKERLQEALREKEKKQQELIQQLIQKDPDAAIKLLEKSGGHHK